MLRLVDITNNPKMTSIIPKKNTGAVIAREFHISRSVRDRYQFDETLFSIRGDIIFANFHATRLFAQRMNEKRDLINFPERSIKAGQLNAMGLTDEISHYVIAQYMEQYAPHLTQEILESLEDLFDPDDLENILRTFVANFPPTVVYKNELTPDEYLEGKSDSSPNREIVIEEMLMLWLANRNPAKMAFGELFDDAPLEQATDYELAMQHIADIIDEYPPFGPEHQSLVALLQRPAEVVPYSLGGQLEYMRTHWAGLLGGFLYRVLGSLDFLAEEEKITFGFGPGPSQVYEFRVWNSNRRTSVLTATGCRVL